MKKKFVMICTVAVVFALVGCSGGKGEEASDMDTSSKDSKSVEATQEEDLSESDASKIGESDSEPSETSKDDRDGGTDQRPDMSDMALGQITAMDGDTITLTLGETNVGGEPSGEAPSGEAPSGEAPSGEAPSEEAPSGEAPSGEAPSGEKPSGGGPGKEGNGEVPFTASDETLTIKFDGTVSVQVMEDGQLTEGSTEDLAIGDILSIAYDEEGAVVSVQIMSQPDKADSGSESTETES